jgi:uncharacterized protein (DUF362 family)
MDMKRDLISRRKFLHTASVLTAGSAILPLNRLYDNNISAVQTKDIVSIVRVKDGNIPAAVEEAIDLLGGIKSLTRGINSVLLKPNLVAPDVRCTTKPEVIRTIAKLLKNSGKEVMIGEASAAADSFNVIGTETYRTRKKEILDRMQQHVFDTLGYSDMAKSLGIPLINLHSGDIVEVALDSGYAANSVKIHRALTESDLICSVPMMKTHTLATVTLSMKNLIGLYPGTEYYSVRSWFHDRAAEKGSPGVAYEVIDMNRAVKTGLSVIDASSAMEGNGPFSGALVDMNLIIAGTTPLATDMVGSLLMGFETDEIPAISLAHKSGMKPQNLSDIEIRGLSIELARRRFVRPFVSKWTDINKFWGVKEL